MNTDAESGSTDTSTGTDPRPSTTDTSEPSTQSSADTTSATSDTADEPLVATLSEVDCHGRDGVEIAAAPGTDLTGLEIVIDGASDYTLPAGAIATDDGLFVVREAEDSSPGLSTDIGCSDHEVALAHDGQTLDALVFPPFPGSWKGTSWCTGVSDVPFDLCTPTLGAQNLPYVDPGPILFDRLHPIEIDLSIDAAGLAALEVQPREYVAGTFSMTTAAGTTDPIEIGIALKGSPGGSFADLTGKAAFKLKYDFVDDDTRLLGLRGLKLNNMREDPSQLHEAVAYAVLGTVGVTVPRSGYAEVRLNGQSYGLHATIERVDDVWLSRYVETTGHLYEGTVGLDVAPGNEALFSIDEGDVSDVSDLTALMAVTALPDDEYFAGADAALHLDAVVRVWAAELLLAHNDGYATERNNYSLHSNAVGVFDFIPSGFDQTQRFLIDPHGGSSPDELHGVLFQRCIEDVQCLGLYDAALADVGQAMLAIYLMAEIDAIAAAIEPWVQADPRRAETLDEVHAAQAETRTYWIDLATALR